MVRTTEQRRPLQAWDFAGAGYGGDAAGWRVNMPVCHSPYRTDTPGSTWDITPCPSCGGLYQLPLLTLQANTFVPSCGADYPAPMPQPLLDSPNVPDKATTHHAAMGGPPLVFFQGSRRVPVWTDGQAKAAHRP